MLDPWDQVDSREEPVLLGHQDQRDKLDRSVILETPVPRVHLDFPVPQEVTGSPGSLDSRDSLELQDWEDHPDPKEQRAMRAQLVLQALLVLVPAQKEERRGHRVLRAFQVLRVQVDKLGHKVALGVLDQLELLEAQVPLELPDQLVQQELWDLQVLLDNRETKGVKVHLVKEVLQDQMVPQEVPEIPDLLDPQDLVEIRASEVILEQRDRAEVRVSQDSLEMLGLLDPLDPLDNQDQMVQLVLKDPLVQPVQLDRRDLQVHLVQRGQVGRLDP